MIKAFFISIFITTFISAALSLAVVPPVSAQGLSDYIAGFPVMAGLEEQADSLVVFDKAEGRILEGSLVGEASKDAVAAYYHESLTQLGWQYKAEDQVGGSMLFSRQGERLELAFEAVASALLIRVSLYPAGH